MEEKPNIFEVEIDNEELLSATSEEDSEEEKQSSLHNQSRVKSSGRNKTNALEMFEKSMTKKFLKQKKLSKFDDLLQGNDRAKDRLKQSLAAGATKK